MAIPRLFKRHSRKNLAGNEQSESSELLPVPPVPVLQFPTPEVPATHTSSPPGGFDDTSAPSFVASAQLVTNGKALRTSEPSAVEFPEPQLSPDINGHQINSAPAFPAPNHPIPSRETEDDAAVAGTLLALSTNIQAHRSDARVEQALNAFDDNVTALQAGEATVLSVVSPLTTAFSASDVAKRIEDGINGFLDGIPVLMKALDEVGKLHPCIQVVVLAFKTIYTLETKRRANDKKVIALYVEMKDMIAVLVQLKTVKDDEEVGPDGITIKGRMQELAKRTAKDMQDCANTCDAYSKMKLLAKVLKGPFWEGSLANFVSLFTKRRTEFEFAVAMHVGRGVDEANRKLDGLTQELQQKTDMILKFLQTYVAPDQRDLMALVEQKGGRNAVLDNDDALKELNSFEAKRPNKGNDPRSRAAQAGHVRRDVLKELKEELRIDPATAISNNLDSFERKFAMQQRLIVEELDRVITRESDRVIATVTSGPHDRILDPDLYTIWKEMGWRGSVKGRHLVLAIRDFYREKAEDRKRKEMLFEIARAEDVDSWALDYLHVKRLQPIIEAFDDDASGFITVAEANTLTSMRPLDWSLPHWMAYWAIGWQIAATQYRTKILALFTKMFTLKATVHPANRRGVDEYLKKVWTDVAKIVLSLRLDYANETIRRHFQSYVDSEEERIKNNLESIRYDIDELDTLNLVTGPGRIEKHIFPVLYLLLKRDCDIMRIAQTHVLHSDELYESADSILWVFDAFNIRFQTLTDVFQQQNVDLAQQFKVVACELFDYWHDSEPLLQRKNMRDNTLFDIQYYGDVEDEDIEPEITVLNYPVKSDDAFDCSVYDPVEYIPTEDDLRAEEPIKAVLGTWHGVLESDGLYPVQAMVRLDFHADPSDKQRCETTGVTPEGTSFTCVGSYGTKTPEGPAYSFTLKYSTRWSSKVFLGRLSEDKRTLSGNWGHGSLGDDPFIFSRLPANVLTFRPSPSDFAANKPRALWRFAVSAVQDQVRRTMFTWSLFKRRRDVRRRYLELTRRNCEYGHPLDAAEEVELTRCRHALTPADARFYESIYLYMLRTTEIHLGISCDVCAGTIGGTRTICLDCDTNNTVDICDDPRCLSSKAEREDLPTPHLPTHAVYKVRTMVHRRDFGRIERFALDARQRARTALKDLEEIEEEQTEGAVDMEDRTADMVKSKLRCIVCKKRVSKPCWYCTTCEDDTFICLSCDPKDGISVEGHEHEKTHPIVKCQDEQPKDKPLSSEEKLELLQEKFMSLGGKIDLVDERLLRMEELMGMMVSKIGEAVSRMTVNANHDPPISDTENQLTRVK